MTIDPRSRIRVGGKRSIPFKTSAGVKQGSVLSPLLFAFYVDAVIDILEKHEKGIALHNPLFDGDRSHYPGMMFVDDLVLAASSWNGMSQQYAITKNVLLELGCIINCKKTKITVGRADGGQEARDFLNQHNLPANCLVDSIKYLGVDICPPYSTQNWGQHTKQRIAKATGAFHALTRKGLPRDGRCISVSLEVYKKAIMPILFYGAEIWNPSSGDLKALESAQTNILRIILGLPTSAPSKWVQWEAGVLPIELELQRAKMRAWWKHQHWVSCYHISTHPVRENRVLKPTMAKLFLEWDMDEDDFFNKTSTPLIPLAKWKQMVNTRAVSMAQSRFAAWCEQRETKSTLPKMNFLFVKAQFGDEVGDVVSGLSQRELSVVLRARADCIGFPTDCKGRSLRRPATGVMCLWHECNQTLDYDSFSHSLNCPAVACPERAALLHAYVKSDPAGNQPEIGDVDEYELAASILASLDLEVQQSAVLFIEALKELRGLF
jgi:hypothetical protein